MFESLNLSQNRKTSFYPGHYNTFGLTFGLPENGGTCPGATAGKGGCLEKIKTAKGERHTCYMDMVVRIYPNAGKALVHNTTMLQGKTQEEMVVILRNTVLKWLLNGGYKQQYFRLHYSGDFFSLEYAQAWAKVLREFPLVTFWVYTRSFHLIDPLLGIANLSLYLSCDPLNYPKAKKLYELHSPAYNNIALAFMGDEIPEELKTTKFVKCPELTGKVKNTKEAGACSRCKLCFTHNAKIKSRNIQFVLH